MSYIKIEVEAIPLELICLADDDEIDILVSCGSEYDQNPLQNSRQGNLLVPSSLPDMLRLLQGKFTNRKIHKSFASCENKFHEI